MENLSFYFNRWFSNESGLKYPLSLSIRGELAGKNGFVWVMMCGSQLP